MRKLSRLSFDVVMVLILFALTLITAHTCAQSNYTPYAFTNFAGLPEVPPGTNDGLGSVARFNRPRGVAVDGAGSVYVADTENHTIRKITPAGEVTTLAGLGGFSGTNDGVGDAARFNEPISVAVDTNGNVFVGDYKNQTIRKITSAGEVTTLAGSPGQSGTNDGPGSVARFNQPVGVAVDKSGNVYVGDYANCTLRKITPAGTVTTLAGSPGQFGNVNGNGSAARFGFLLGVTVDSTGNIYAADRGNYTIRKITPAGDVTTLAGSAGQNGSADGTGGAAQFFYPNGVGVDSVGYVYVTDQLNNTIRRVTSATAVVTTLAGSVGQSGFADGIGSEALFDVPTGLAADRVGTVYVADTFNNRITKGAQRPLQFDTVTVSLTISNGFFQTLLRGPFDSSAIVESSVDLQVWTPIQTNALPPNGLNLSLPTGADQRKFFRARLAP